MLPTEVLLAGAIVGTPFVGALLLAAIRAFGRAGTAVPYLGLGSALLTMLLVVWFWATVARPVFWRIDWIPEAGIGVGLYVDNLSVLFAVLVAGVSLLTLLYSFRYIPHELAKSGASGGEVAYYAYMLMFTGSMLGMVFAADLIQLYVFWELTGLVSFLLIGLNWHEAQARRGAVKALVITALGGLAMLIGLVVLGWAVGSFSIPDVLRTGVAFVAAPTVGLVTVLVIIGAATKSAQFPFHIWLPSAMVAPTPVSAFLHSAALVAAGVYLLARFHPMFADTLLWQWLLVPIGIASVLVGGALALRATEFKELLAYSTISQYGFIFALLGFGTGGALAAGLFSFLQHGLVKAALFLAAGVVTYATGQRELGTSGRLWSRMPFAFLVTAALALSLGGLPGFAGFWMKELFLEAIIETHNLALIALAVGAGALTLAYMLRFLHGTFLAGPPATDRIAAVPASMLAVPAVGAALTLLFGLWPALAGVLVIEPAVLDVLGEPALLDLALHIDLQLTLSLVALGLGALAFVTYGRWGFLIGAVARPAWSLERLYAGAFGGLGHAGRTVLRLQSGFLGSYINISLAGLLALLVFSSLALLRALPLPGMGGRVFAANEAPFRLDLALVLALVAVGTVLTFVLQRHSHVILALGAVGYLIAGVFALEFAPDVALVQVHVETLVTVLFVLSLVLIPRAVRQHLVRSAWQRLSLWMVSVAVLGGLGSAWLSWLAIEYAAQQPIAPWFNENAFALTGAGDVVAAILVEFRALDTLGEITVFAIAMIGVYALVRMIRREAT